MLSEHQALSKNDRYMVLNNKKIPIAQFNSIRADVTAALLQQTSEYDEICQDSPKFYQVEKLFRDYCGYPVFTDAIDDLKHLFNFNFNHHHKNPIREALDKFNGIDILEPDTDKDNRTQIIKLLSEIEGALLKANIPLDPHGELVKRINYVQKKYDIKVIDLVDLCTSLSASSDQSFEAAFAYWQGEWDWQLQWERKNNDDFKKIFYLLNYYCYISKLTNCPQVSLIRKILDPYHQYRDTDNQPIFKLKEEKFPHQIRIDIRIDYKNMNINQAMSCTAFALLSKLKPIMSSPSTQEDDNLLAIKNIIENKNLTYEINPHLRLKLAQHFLSANEDRKDEIIHIDAEYLFAIFWSSDKTPIQNAIDLTKISETAFNNLIHVLKRIISSYPQCVFELDHNQNNVIKYTNNKLKAIDKEYKMESDPERFRYPTENIDHNKFFSTHAQDMHTKLSSKIGIVCMLLDGSGYSYKKL